MLRIEYITLRPLDAMPVNSEMILCKEPRFNQPATPNCAATGNSGGEKPFCWSPAIDHSSRGAPGRNSPNRPIWARTPESL